MKAMSVLAVALALAACDRATPIETQSALEPAAAVVGAGIPSHVTVEFGRDRVGSPFPPPDEHDGSAHARDKVFPREVVLARGGSVTFDMGTFHQVAIFAAGTQPGDIDASATVDLTDPSGAVIIPGFLIDVAGSALAVGPFSFAPTSWTSPAGTFDEPGLYLVICTVVPHFVGADMYAWVRVK
jgi:hypothetical protein